MSASPNSSHQLYILPEPGLLDQLEQVRSLAPLSSYTPEAVFLCPEEEAETLRGLYPEQTVLSFSQGHLTSGRADLPEQRRLLAPYFSRPPSSCAPEAFPAHRTSLSPGYALWA